MAFLYHVQAIVLALAVGVTAVVGAGPSTQPNLVHIVVDDLGFNDVGYKNPEVLSPNLDKLRAEGVELARFYSAKWCAPSRATMLTGRYAWRSGYYSDQNNAGVSLDTELLPAVLQRAGYRTYAIGKWHLGFEMKQYTPTFRGFDSFLGYYNSMEDYWTHYGPSATGPCTGIDLSNNTKVDGIHAAARSLNGTYSSEMYGAEAVRVILAHVAEHAEVPFYMYLPFQSVHMPNEAPAEMVDKYPASMRNTARRSYLGMISAFDEALGNVINVMKITGVWNNTIVFLTGDNGGPVWCSSMENCGTVAPYDYGPVSNYPLRSGKWTSWDGAFRVNALFSSPLIPSTRRNTSWSGMMHMSDIFPTFTALAGIDAVNDKRDGSHPLDGTNMWPTIIAGGVSPREEIAHTITNKWNVVNGLHDTAPCNACSEQKNPIPGKNCAAPFNTSADPNGISFRGCGGALQMGDLKLIVGYPGDTTLYGKPEMTIGQGGGHDNQLNINKLPLLPCQTHCLFNTSADPSETIDLTNDTRYAPELAKALARYAELATQGRDILTLQDMAQETGNVCISNVNDSCAVAVKYGYVEPCGFEP